MHLTRAARERVEGGLHMDDMGWHHWGWGYLSNKLGAHAAALALTQVAGELGAETIEICCWSSGVLSSAVGIAGKQPKQSKAMPITTTGLFMKLSRRTQLAPFIQAILLVSCGDTDRRRRLAVLGKACINLDLIRSGSDSGLATQIRVVPLSVFSKFAESPVPRIRLPYSEVSGVLSTPAKSRERSRASRGSTGFGRR